MRTTGSPVLTSVANTAGLAVGQTVTGTGIPAGTTITAISGTTVTLSANATSTSTTAFNIAAYGSATIKTDVIGTAPNRTFIIEWANFQRFNVPGSQLNFQIHLDEGGGVASAQTIRIVYGTFTAPNNTTNYTAQVGLRGITNTDFNNRTSTTDWNSTTAGATNTASVTYNSTVVLPTPGLTFTYSPPAACSGVPTAGSLAATASAVCAGQSTTLTLTGATNGTGITYAFRSSTTQGGPYTTTLGTTGSTTTRNTGALTQTTYYIVDVVCATGPDSSATAEIAVTVNPLPSVTLTNSNPAGYCAGSSGSVTLTASGASTYTYSPATGLSATTGPSVTASPTSTTTYIVTGTDANGCIDTGITTVNVIPNSIVEASASPASVCVNGSTQLNAIAAFEVVALKITEITYFRTGTGQTPTYPATVGTGDDLVEISNISGSPVDAGGVVYELYTGTTLNRSYTIPAGTVIPAMSVLVLHLGTGTDNATNRFFNTGGSSNSLSSGGAAGHVLKYAGAVIDAVATNAYSFPSTANVSAADFSGSASALSGNAGTVRTAATDNNLGSDFTTSASATQSIGTYNSGANYVFSLTSSPFTTSYTYSWTPSTNLNNPAIANPTANNLTATTTYTVTATEAGAGCSGGTDSVTVLVGTPVVAAFSANDSTLCAGQAVTLTAS
ncbi:MAG TPA: hypothetical protein VGB67_14980, partial [Fibrella sp.]